MLALVPDNVSTILLLCILIAAVGIDVRRHRIPNILSFGAILVGLGLQVWALGTDGFLIGLGGLGVGLLVFLPLHLLGGMGAGDVKLMAAVGTFLGPSHTLLAAGVSLGVGGVLGVLLWLARGAAVAAALRRYASTLQALFFTRTLSPVSPHTGEAPASRFAFAPAIAIGTVVALWWLKQLGQQRWIWA